MRDGVCQKKRRRKRYAVRDDDGPSGEIRPAALPLAGTHSSAATRPRRVAVAARRLLFESRNSKDKSPASTRRPGFHGPSGEIRTRGIQLPKLAPYQLGHTRE